MADITTVIATATIVGGAVAAFLRVRGDTKDAMTVSTDKRVDDAQSLAAEWRDNYLAERQARTDAESEAKAQRELRHTAETQVSALKMATDLTGLQALVNENHSAIVTQLAKMDENLSKTAEILSRLLEPASKSASKSASTA